MSYPCTHCGNYNTELRVLGSLEFAAKGVAKGAAVLGGAIGGGVILGKIGALYCGTMAYRSTTHWTKGVLTHHCNACGCNFSVYD